MNFKRAERRREDRDLRKARALWKIEGAIQADRCILKLDVGTPLTMGVQTNLRVQHLAGWPPQGQAPVDQITKDARGNPLHLKPVLRIDALVDTGATASTIHYLLAQHLGLRVVGRTNMKHAGGNQSVDVVAACILLPPTAKGHDAMPTNIYLISSNLNDTQMLFGMDLLNGGVLTVDRIREAWTWELKDLHHLKRLGLNPAPKVK